MRCEAVSKLHLPPKALEEAPPVRVSEAEVIIGNKSFAWTVSPSRSHVAMTAREEPANICGTSAAVPRRPSNDAAGE